MSIRLLFGESKISIPIDTSAYLESVGIDPLDITAAIFGLKLDKTLADDAEGVYTAMWGGGYLTNVGPLFSVFISDWTGLLIEKKYHIGLGIKISGDSSFREVPLSPDTNTIYFTQDMFRS